jgi:hypothetical protein
MSLRAHPAAALSMSVLALAGCGSTTIRHVTTTITRPAATSAPSATSASATHTTTHATASHTTTTTSHETRAASRTAVSPLHGHSPLGIIELAAAALRRSHGYAMRADLVQDHQRTIITLTTSGRDRFAASLTTSHAMFSVISLPGAAYLRGDRAFWRSQVPTAAGAARLAGRWLHVPDSGARSVTGTLGTLSPGTFARCLTEDHGALTVAGHATIDGTSALIIRDAGNAPGATPSTIAVTSSGAPYPLRYIATGATRRGGRVDVCNNGRGGGATGTITLSQFGHTPVVQAPSRAGSADGAQT